jgi:hypothetical protein
MPDPYAARLLALELAFVALAETLHRQRAVKLGAVTDAMASRAGMLAVTGDPSLAAAGDALNQLIAERRVAEAEAGLRGDDG